MQPKIICAQCGSTLERKDVLCPACGVAVDWSWVESVIEADVHTKTPKEVIGENKFRGKIKSSVWSSKSFFIAVAIIAFAIILYAIFLEKRTTVDVVQPASQPVSASAQIPLAIQELESSVAANPDNISLTLQLANSLQDGLFYEKAIPYYKTYLTMNPTDANAHVDMGICYKELGNYTEAENAMKAALHYAPNHLQAHFNLGIVYLNEGNIQEANIWFKRTVALDPTGDVGKRAQQLLTQHNSQ